MKKILLLILILTNNIFGQGFSKFNGGFSDLSKFSEVSGLSVLVPTTGLVALFDPGADMGLSTGNLTYVGTPSAPSATAVDYSINTNDGTCQNGLELLQPGTHDYSYIFTSASSHYINFGNVNNLGTSNFILFAWVKLTSTAADQVIMNKRAGSAAGNRGWHLMYHNATSKYRLEMADGAAEFNLYSTATPLSSWTFVALFIDRTTTANCNMYINGVDATDSRVGVSTIGTIDITNNYLISSLNVGSRFVNGNIGLAGIYIDGAESVIPTIYANTVQYFQ